MKKIEYLLIVFGLIILSIFGNRAILVGQVNVLEYENKLHIGSLNQYIVFEEYNGNSEDSLKKVFNGIDNFHENYDTIKLDGQTYFIVEGDLLLNLKDLKIYKNRINRPSQNEKLVVIFKDGEFVKIQNPTNIRYAIIRKSFISENEYFRIVEFMNQATSDWSKVCNVKFVHISEMDAILKLDDNPDSLSFIVKKIAHSSDNLLASSFFPYDQKDNRKVLITPAFFKTSFNKSGILRHEIGHILGFRHEHIRSGAPARCPKESLDDTFDLTQYDPQSVMHYFCGRMGSKELQLTKIDSIGASRYYK